MRNCQKVAVGILAMLVAGCGLRLPDPAPYVANCAEVPVSMPSDEGIKHFFFLSTALPNCRDGELKLANYRYAQQTFGSGNYEVLTGDDVQRPSLAMHDAEEWRSALRAAIAQPGNDGRLIVFIHGYATSFKEAHMDGAGVRELAQGDPPLVVIYWPSRDRAQDYVRDISSINWAQASINDALAELTGMADDITLVTHSMGARAGTAAAVALDSNPDARPDAVKRIVLASPDFDRDQAVRSGGTLDRLVRKDREVLVYSSRRDRALQASRTVNGYARLGSTSCENDLDYLRGQRDDDAWCHLTEPREGLAIVATGPADTQGLLRHNDFLKSCHVREDLKAFLRDQSAPVFRKTIEEDGLVGFKIDPGMDYPDAPCAPMKDM